MWYDVLMMKPQEIRKSIERFNKEVDIDAKHRKEKNNLH